MVPQDLGFRAVHPAGPAEGGGGNGSYTVCALLVRVEASKVRLYRIFISRLKSRL